MLQILMAMFVENRAAWRLRLYLIVAHYIHRRQLHHTCHRLRRASSLPHLAWNCTFALDGARWLRGLMA